jgi:hypothetical protein
MDRRRFATFLRRIFTSNLFVLSSDTFGEVGPEIHGVSEKLEKFTKLHFLLSSVARYVRSGNIIGHNELQLKVLRITSLTSPIYAFVVQFCRKS